MIEPGRVCIKKCGRDAGKKCVVINIIDDKFVEIFSPTRKRVRKCNIIHLIPTDKKVDPTNEKEIKEAIK